MNINYTVLYCRQPKPEQWDPEDDNTDGGQEGGDNEGAGSDGGSGVSLDDDLLSDDDESVTLRKRPNRRHTMASERHGKHRDGSFGRMTIYGLMQSWFLGGAFL